MIQYLNKKDIYGPFHTRAPVYLPHSAEVTSDKYTNMYVKFFFKSPNLAFFALNWWTKKLLMRVYKYREYILKTERHSRVPSLF